MFFYITFETIILNALNVIAPGFMAVVRYGIEGIGYVLLFMVFVIRIHDVKKIIFFDYLIIATIFISIATSIVNTDSIQIFVIGFRYLLRYLYIYLLIRYINFADYEIIKIFRMIRIVMIIEIILVIWQIIDPNSSYIVLFPHYRNIIEGFNSALNTVISKLAVFGSLGRYNLFGYFITLAIWYWIAEQNEKKTKKNLLMIIVWILLLVISFSRQTIIGIIGAYILYVFSKKKITLKHLLFIIGIFSVLIILFIKAFSFTIPDNYTNVGIGTVNSSIYDRYISMFSLQFLQIDYEGYGRTWFLSEGILRLIKEKPLFGFGIGMYGCPDTLKSTTYLYNKLGIPTTYYMDVYLGCLIGQIGIIGTAIYLSLYINIAAKAKAVFTKKKNDVLYRKLSIITFGIVVSALIMIFFSSSLCNRVMAYYLWLFIGLFVSRQR